MFPKWTCQRPAHNLLCIFEALNYYLSFWGYLEHILFDFNVNIVYFQQNFSYMTCLAQKVVKPAPLEDVDALHAPASVPQLHGVFSFVGPLITLPAGVCSARLCTSFVQVRPLARCHDRAGDARANRPGAFVIMFR